ncbi:hypothetical protein U1Q18_040469 [Sarracenia purpurea var. burkii]
MPTPKSLSVLEEEEISGKDKALEIIGSGQVFVEGEAVSVVGSKIEEDGEADCSKENVVGNYVQCPSIRTLGVEGVWNLQSGVKPARNVFDKIPQGPSVGNVKGNAVAPLPRSWAKVADGNPGGL